MTVIELLLLTTVSARSGRLRETPLAHVRYGDDLVVVASNYGSQMNPAWHLDLVAHPIVTVEVSGEQSKCRARTPEGRERELLYGRLGEQMPGFLVAQGRTRRQTGIVVPIELGIPLDLSRPSDRGVPSIRTAR